jgi:putative transposase
MCCSVIINNQRLILYALPMKRGDYTEKIVKQILEKIKKYLKISEVLFDRGFASKKIVQTLTLLNVKYVILCPKRTNVKRFLQKNLWRVTEVKKINSNFSTYSVEMKYVIAYDFKDHDWIMLTNINRKPYSLVRLYKKRWGIETAFRVMDHADIKSKSTNIVIRTFFFIVSIVLYNMWVFKEDRWQCTFKTFVYEMNIVLKEYLKKLDYLEEEMLALVS